jgi:4-amino-4-deoxy-L-arabinose transferase-like glycosyltransferase
VVLLVQAGLSARLTWTDTAYAGEAQYLRAGHLEWAHWLHHAPVPDFAAYFSGAPVGYPLLGALADGAGGLAAARLLSLAFMLGVTALLWATTTRLYGRRAALLACGLFATLAGTQFLGSLATFDAPALFLLALATWLGVRAVAGPTAAGWTLGRVALLTGAGLALATADGTKYATVLFTPVVIVVVGLAGRRGRPSLRGAAGTGGGGAELVSAGIVLAAWTVAVAAAGLAGGRTYWQGLTTSTLARPTVGSPVGTVLREAYVWTSLILVLAVLGMWLAARSRERARFLPAVLLAAALLAPAAAAGLRNSAGLPENVVFGAWFAAIAAGYGLARLSRVDRGYGWAVVMALPIGAATLFGSLGQAHTLHRAWPDATALIRVLRPAAHAHPGSYLAEDDDVPAYYLGSQVRWPDWSGTGDFRYGGQRAGARSYAAAITRHHFALIVLDFGDTAAADAQITADLRQAGGYHVLAQAGRFTVWADGGKAPAEALPVNGGGPSG